MFDILEERIERIERQRDKLLEIMEEVVVAMLEYDFDYGYERGRQGNSEDALALAAKARAAIAAARGASL